MLILKGNSMKSDVVYRIMGQEDSICFVYYNEPVIRGGNSIFVDKNKYSLEDLFNEIDSMFEKDFYDEYFRYLIIYTNEKESKLKEYIDWMEENRIAFRCSNILITCVD